jgi:hypothetical protein
MGSDYAFVSDVLACNVTIPTYKENVIIHAKCRLQTTLYFILVAVNLLLIRRGGGAVGEVRKITFSGATRT